MKIGSFIGSIISAVISLALTTIVYVLGADIIGATGLKEFASIVMYPLLILVYVLLLGSLTSGLITSVIAIFASATYVKVTSILLLLLFVGLTVFNVIYGVQIINNF